MPLHVPPAPAPALRTVLTALGSPTAVREARTPSLLHAQGPCTPELPLPVHVLDRLTPAGETATRLAGWRFLIRCGERAVAAAETMLTPDGWAFSHFFEGPYIASTERALRQAEAMKQPYQPRLLSVPSLYMLDAVAARRLHGGRCRRPPRRHRPARPAGAGTARHRGPPPAPGRRTAPGAHPSGDSRPAAQSRPPERHLRKRPSYPAPEFRVAGYDAVPPALLARTYSLRYLLRHIRSYEPLTARTSPKAPLTCRTSPIRPRRTTRSDSAVGMNRPRG